MNDDGTDPDFDEALPTEQPTVDAASPRQHRRRIDKAKRAEAQRKAWWTAALNDPIGRQELWGLLRDSHAFETRFACGPNGAPQAEATWFHLGEQQFGLRLYQTWLALDPVAVGVMHAEHDTRFKKPDRTADDD